MNKAQATERLFQAIGSKDLNSVRQAIADGADVNYMRADNKSPLLLAVERNGYVGAEGILDEILKNENLDINIQTPEYKRSAAHYAILSEDPVAYKKLKDAGINLSLTDIQKQTAEELYAEKQNRMPKHARNGWDDNEGFDSIFNKVPATDIEKKKEEQENSPETQQKKPVVDTLTFYHGSSSFFDRFDHEKVSTQVYGYGIYLTDSIQESYNYAYANGGASISKNNDINVVYKVEVAKEGLINAYLPIKQEHYDKIMAQAVKEGNKEIQERLSKAVPGKTQAKDVIGISMDSSRSKEENDFFTRAGIAGVFVDKWVILFGDKPITQSEAIFASVKEGIEIPEGILSKDASVMTFTKEGKRSIDTGNIISDYRNGKMDSAGLKETEIELQKDSELLKEFKSIVSNLYEGEGAKRKPEYAALIRHAFGDELSYAIKNPQGFGSISETMNMIHNMDEDLGRRIGNFFYDRFFPKLKEAQNKFSTLATSLQKKEEPERNNTALKASQMKLKTVSGGYEI